METFSEWDCTCCSVFGAAFCEMFPKRSLDQAKVVQNAETVKTVIKAAVVRSRK